MTRDENIIAALAVVLAEEIKRAVGEVVGSAGESAAAVIVLGENQGLSMGDLAQALSLTPSGIGRLIDRLEAEGFVARASGTDQRSVLPSLTEEGHRLRIAALEARERVIQRASAGMTENEVKAVAPFFSKMLQNLLIDRRHCHRFCRLCDEAACEPNCPVDAKDGELATLAEADSSD